MNYLITELERYQIGTSLSLVQKNSRYAPDLKGTGQLNFRDSFNLHILIHFVFKI